MTSFDSAAPTDEITQLENRAVWQVNAAIGRDCRDLADELARTYVDAVLAVLTETAH